MPVSNVAFISAINAVNATEILVNEVEKVVCIKRQLVVTLALRTAICAIIAVTAVVKNRAAFVERVLKAKSLDACNVRRLVDAIVTNVINVVDTSNEAFVAARLIFAKAKLNCSVTSNAELPKAKEKFAALVSIIASIATNAVLKSVGNKSVLSVNIVLIVAIDVINDVPTDIAVILNAAVALRAV